MWLGIEEERRLLEGDVSGVRGAGGMEGKGMLVCARPVFNDHRMTLAFQQVDPKWLVELAPKFFKQGKLPVLCMRIFCKKWTNGKGAVWSEPHAMP